MEPTYFAKMMLSALLFAPGLILLAAWLFVGVLAFLEKTGVFDVVQRRERQTKRPLVRARHEA